MTSANSHETVTGRVEARNERGIRIGDDWYNRSQFHPVELPDVGAQVSLSVDGKVFIRTIEVVDDKPASPSSREQTISRLAVLKAAANFAANKDLKSGDVLRIADSWLEWVEP